MSMPISGVATTPGQSGPEPGAGPAAVEAHLYTSNTDGTQAAIISGIVGGVTNRIANPAPAVRFQSSSVDSASLRYVDFLLPGIIGVAMGAFTLSYDEYARTTLTIGQFNTLPLEIYALISSSTSPTLFAIGTLTTAGSFLAIGITLTVIMRIQRRRVLAIPKEG